MKSFSEISLCAPLRSNLTKHGFTEPTPVQALAVAPILAGRNVVATAQTGTGKTLAFVLPLIQLLGEEAPGSGVRSLILTPTRELAIQIHEVFEKMAAGTGISAAVVVGGLSEKTQLNAIRKGAQVLIATPGRLCDFLTRKLARLGGVRILILDEADRMLDMGFLPTIKRILAATPADRQTLFFSATIESSVQHLVEAHARNAVRVEVGSITKPSEQVDLHVYEVEQDSKLGLLQMLLRREQGPFLVFARTKHGADRLSKRLAREGVKAATIHGDRSQNQRNDALRGFQEGYYRVLVATDVAARGIHVEGISHVVNYDLPQVPEDFIHRVGRTGRAGARGIAATFGTRSERSEISRIERTLAIKLTRQPVPVELGGQRPGTASVVMIEAAAVRQRRWMSFGGPSRSGRRRASASR